MKNHLIKLEEEAISIIRDTYADSENPLFLYSIGKDSSVLLELFKKAFYPSNIPVPFLHIDTGWKFKEMIDFRNTIYKENKLKGLVYSNEGMKLGINPFDNSNYTDVMKTKALRDALKTGGYDFIYGGAEETKRQVAQKKRLYHTEIKIIDGIQKTKVSNHGIYLIL